MHLTVDDLELGTTQGLGRAAGMPSGLQVELIAVPGADDVRLVLVELQHPGPLLAVDRLDHPLVDAPLADRALSMRALIVPGDELAIDLEYADLDAIAGHDLPAALGQLVDFSDRVGLHCTAAPCVRTGRRGCSLERLEYTLM